VNNEISQPAELLLPSFLLNKIKMSHHLWWSEELVNDVPAEVFLPPTSLSPRSELISKLDPLDVLKSEEFIIRSYPKPEQTDCNADPPQKKYNVDFNDPASASASASLVCNQVIMDSTIRSDDDAVFHLLGNMLPAIPLRPIPHRL
jgi:hypothetical protein